MTQALPNRPAQRSPRLPPHLPESTVSEIAFWLVGHTLDSIERELIRHTLESCGGDRVLAASVLGISLPALRRKMTAYAVRGQPLPEPARPADESRAHAQASERRTIMQAPQAANDREPEPTTVFAKREKPKMLEFRLLLGGFVAAAVIVLAGFLLLGANEPDRELSLRERPRIQLSIMETQRLFEPRIPVPAWIAPPVLPVPPVAGNIAADRREESAAASAASAPALEADAAFDSEHDPKMELGDTAPATLAGSPAAASGPLASADILEDTRMEPGPVDIAQDTKMEPGPVDIAQDTRMEAGPVDIAQDTRMERGPVDIAQDTRMESAPVEIALDTRMELAAEGEAGLPGSAAGLATADVSLDTRMDLAAGAANATTAAAAAVDGAPETTGSIDPATAFVAQDVPMPLARPEPPARAKPAIRQAARPRQAAPTAPATAETPAQNVPFPFSIFAIKSAQPAAAESMVRPDNCCRR